MAAQDEFELAVAKVESELMKVKRQLKKESGRTDYIPGEAGNLLRSQKLIIEKLETDKAELVLAIGATKSPQNAQKDNVLAEKLDELLKKRAGFIEEIKMEKLKLAEIEEQIFKLSKEVHVLKSKVVTDAQIQEATTKHKRNIFILENRLDVSAKRFNALVAGNASLRHEIDGLLKDRASFNDIWAKLSGQMSLGKGVINDLIEQATLVYNQRDEELNKIEVLRDKSQRVLKAHVGEMSELQRTIDNETKLQEFLGVKGQYRQMDDLNAKLAALREAKKEDMRNKVATYNHILDVVKSATGETEISKLIAQFLKQEEENFSLFNYCNELKDELEVLRSSVGELRQAIDEARALNVRRGQQQADTLDSIAKELQDQTERTKQSDKSLREVDATTEKLLSGIGDLFKSIECDSSPILPLLGDNSKVNANNVMLYLNIIEKRIAEMLCHVDEEQDEESGFEDDEVPKLQQPDYSSVLTPCPLVREQQNGMRNCGQNDGAEQPHTEKK